jgi:hypothetical protein
MLEGIKFKNFPTFNKFLRTSFIDKLSLTNTFANPRISKVTVFLDLKSLDSFDSARLVAAFFILRLLSGRKPYVLRFGLFQTFRERDYDVVVSVDLTTARLYDFLAILAYKIFPFLSKADFSSNALVMEDGIAVNYAVADLSFIRVVETHSIFFKWHDIVRIRLNFSTFNFAEVDLKLSSLKLNCNYKVLKNK